MHQLSIDLIEDVPSPISDDQFATVLSRTYKEYGLGNAVVEILLTTDQRMRQLNRAHRGNDTETDVLSLPTAIDTKQGRVVPDSAQPTHLGTIVISIDEAERHLQHPTRGVEEGRWGTTLQEVVRHLAEHGLRHLLGHEHDKEGRWQIS